MAVKVGILGSAHGHVMTYGAVWANDPSLGIEIAGLYDHDAERANQNAAALKTVVKSLDDILEDREITAVVVSSETVYHCELVEKAAAAGKAIICYKPMALNLEQANRMVAAVEKYNVPFTLGYQMRVDDQNIRMKKIIDEEELGKVFLYRRRHSLSTHTWAGFDKAWHTQPELNRDIFADDSAHPIDMLNWIFGVPESVMCEMSTMTNIKNDGGVALFKYPNGMIAEISCYFMASAAEITTEIYCADGSVAQYYGDAVSASKPRPEGLTGLKWYKNGDADWTDSNIPSPPAHGERIKAQAYPFAQFLKGERGPICSVYEARDSLRMVLACYVSVAEGRRVRLDDPAIDRIV